MTDMSFTSEISTYTDTVQILVNHYHFPRTQTLEESGTNEAAGRPEAFEFFIRMDE